MKAIRYGFLTACMLMALVGQARAQLKEKQALTLDGAKKVAAAAASEARRNNAGGVIAVVDDGGNLMYLERLDGTFAAGARVSTGKARTAAMFQRPTSVFENLVNNGRTTMVALEDFTPLQGGIPISVEGQVVGAIGVSGASSAQQDEEFALAGAKALEGVSASNSDAVTYFDSKKVSEAFVKGAPLIETDSYKVHASHREGPGKAEVHDADTDIIYVLDGTATFVTGGAVVNGMTTAPGEIRGDSIENGATHRLKKGDVIIVPRGTPHWFTEVSKPFNYYVVKTQ